MTKSTITRERLQELAEGQSGFNLRTATHEESQELARMALAAMDSSESVELPLDYLQGHKDGLEWAARLAEANHPETGDWLYDDPIELAKAIRKGPDMPPVQPVADSEPVIVVGDDGGDALSYRRLIQSFEPGTKLYRHAQPVPVVSADLLHTAASAIEDLLEHTDPNTSYYSGVWADVPGKLRAAMLQAQSDDDGEPTDDERIMAIEGILNCDRCGDEGWIVGEMGITRCACGQAGNSPAIPDCWCRTCRPVVLNDMRFVVCPDCGNKRCPRANDHRNACTGSNEPGQEGSAYPAAPQEVKP